MTVSRGLIISSVCFAALGVVALLVTIVWQTLLVEKVLESRIRGNLQISEDKKVYQTWSRTPIPVYTEYYFFNVTNAEEFRLNTSITPIVQQVGPYVYRQYREKVNITFSDTLVKDRVVDDSTLNPPEEGEDALLNKTFLERDPKKIFTNPPDEDEDVVSYYMKKTFVFDEELSVGSEQDMLTLINIPYAGVANRLRGMPPFKRFTSSLFVAAQNPEFFTNRTVDEMLYGGYFEKLIDAVQKANNEILLPNSMFGLYYNKNGTVGERFTVNRGIVDNTKYAQIVAFNDSRDLPYWSGESCNEIKGTDAGQYAPFVSKDERLYFFMTELCRSGYLKYTGDTELDGIPLYRFRIPPDFLAAPDQSEENKCYCANVGKGECNITGILDIGPCKKGAPIVVSQPHFLNSNPPLYEQMEGLNPDPEIHDTYVDVDPVTGAVMRAQRKLQLNIKVNPVAGIKYYKDIEPMIFPVVWVNERVKLTPELVARYKDAVQSKVNMLRNTVPIGYGIAAGLLVIALLLGLCVVFKRGGSRKKETLRMVASSDKKGPAATALLGQNGNSNHTC